ncbi:putative membrane protein [Paenibacillus polymyxa]|uniref:DUF1700 domain-containing protein n=1 Tax=Paenibacillus polymyxa TaxID=1406 RepID=UPI00279374AD|nr:DUF1700 domain-containing protein [Paenibacillus polymyxa]MDQ0045971.1 putative membrane protein [Paenibacillus polymyxa]
MDKKLSSTAEKYLRELNDYLHKLPRDEREDSVNEIRSHIEEGLRKGYEEQVIFKNLGKPSDLASSFIWGGYLKRNSSNPLAILGKIGFYFSASFISMFVIPIFTTLSIGFAVSSLLAVFGGLARTFGANWANMSWFGMEVPRLLSFPVSLLVGMPLMLLAWGSWFFLINYMKYLTTKHRRIRFR